MQIYLVATPDRKVFGVGQTGRDVSARHVDRDWAKVHGLFELLGQQVEVVRVWSNVDVTDHEIHKWLAKQPGIRRKNEWFTNPSTIEVVEDMIHRQFFSGVSSQRDSLSLRHYQQAFVDKAHKPYTEFLLAAKCRAGKSVMTLSHIVDRGFKTTLLVSRFCSPSDSWFKDARQYDAFENLVVINMADKNWFEQYQYWLQTDKQVVLWSTVQGLKRRLAKLNTIDLLVFDEAHVGDSAKQFISLRESLADTPCLKISGTAYDQLWSTTEDNRYVYDYFQEQLDVANGTRTAPRMKVILAKYESEGYSQVYGDDPDAMKNLFLIKDGQFVDEYLVKEFIAKYFDTNRDIRPKDRLLHDSNHMFVCLPSVEACYLLQPLLDGIIPTLVVTGDSKNTSDDIHQFVNEHNRTVCLTVSANVLGVTQRKWDTVINCREGSSIQFWTQFAFRGGSADHDWRVIDFVPTRALSSLRETFALAADLNPELSQYDFTDFIPIYEWDRQFEEADYDTVINLLAADPGSLSSLFTSNSDVDIDALSEYQLSHAFDYEDEITKSVVLNNEALNPTSAKVRVSDSSDPTPNDLQAKLETIKAIKALLPEVVFYMRLNNNHVISIWDVVNSSGYGSITGDTEGDLPRLLLDKVVSSAALSRRVTLARVSIDASLARGHAATLEALERSTGTQQGIPVSVLEAIL